MTSELTPMDLSLAVLALAAVAGAARAWRREVARRQGVLRAGLSVALAAALALALFPPRVSRPADTVTVLTPGATAADLKALPWFATAVALPGAMAPKTIETAPDLATALRRHPEARTVDVRGNGLPPRDQPVAATRPLRFMPGAESGLVALNAPARALLGTQWRLDGRALLPAARVELRDPSGAVVDQATLGADGVFRLSALARATGEARYELRAFDAAQGLVEAASIPLLIEPGEGLRAIVRAGAPDPELKYWRRWASDAGIAVAVSAGVSDGLSLRDGDAALTASALAESDLVIVDERAWLALLPAEKSALLAAVRDGLGLLLRVAGPLEPGVAADWQALGLVTENLDTPSTVTLDRRTGLRARETFTAAPVTITATGWERLLEDDRGAPLAQWRSEGLGRIGVWTLLDSYRLVLLGEPARYGSLWQGALATITRPRAPEAEAALPATGWIDERSVLCGLGDRAAVLAPSGALITLLPRADRCAAFWPSESGWHRIQSGAESRPFYVRAADDAPGLRAARDRAATRRLVGRTADGVALRDVPLPRWPFALLFLLLASALWWRERPR